MQQRIAMDGLRPGKLGSSMLRPYKGVVVVLGAREFSDRAAL